MGLLYLCALENLQNILSTFEPISLKEMDGVALMNRTDTKFMLSLEQLLPIVKAMSSEYRVLEVNGNRISGYETLYYDTPDFLFYRRHHSGKKNRLKIRKRKYIESDLTFLEVKFKSNKDRTIKDRTKLPGIDEQLDQANVDFIKDETEFDQELVPKLWNNFSRITLVGKTIPERITIDLNLEFRTNNAKKPLHFLVIVEVKQSNQNRRSPFMAQLKHALIRPESMSKYCLGVAMLFPDMKSNAFKEKILRIKKLNNGIAA